MINSSQLKFTPNLKILITPVLVILICIIVFYTFVINTFTVIDKEFKNYNSAKKEENLLQLKLESLKVITMGLLDPGDVSVVALPNKNPGIWLVSQFRKISEEQSVNIIKISINTVGGQEEIKTANLDLEMETDDYTKLLSFLENVTDILPIYSIKSISTNSKLVESLISFNFRTSFYWSDFPTTIPALNAPINQLTAEEVNLNEVLAGYKKPTFIELTPNLPTERETPFN